MVCWLDTKTTRANGVSNSTEAMYGPVFGTARGCLYLARKRAVDSSRRCPRKYASRIASSESGELNANDSGETTRSASNTARKAREDLAMGKLPRHQLDAYSPRRVSRLVIGTAIFGCPPNPPIDNNLGQGQFSFFNF